MASRGQVAKAVREQKEKHPELFCPRCLWKTGGGPCPRHGGKLDLMQDTVARPLAGGKTWALMNRQETGMAASALFYAKLTDIPRSFNVRIGAPGEDEHGSFVRIHRV